MLLYLDDACGFFCNAIRKRDDFMVQFGVHLPPIFFDVMPSLKMEPPQCSSAYYEVRPLVNACNACVAMLVLYDDYA